MDSVVRPTPPRGAEMRVPCPGGPCWHGRAPARMVKTLPAERGLVFPTQQSSETACDVTELRFFSRLPVNVSHGWAGHGVAAPFRWALARSLPDDPLEPGAPGRRPRCAPGPGVAR